jgi:hypothetical protein
MRTLAETPLNHGLFINYSKKEQGYMFFIGTGNIYMNFAIGCYNQIDTDYGLCIGCIEPMQFFTSEKKTPEKETNL